MNQKICGYQLDNQQKEIVLDESDYLLVTAGAGSGKTLTILGKLYYLIEIKKIDPKEIICISFTKATSDSLREKIKKEFNYNVPVYTFHKLGLEILKEKNNYNIADVNTLDDIIKNFFKEDILKSKYHVKLIKKYFKTQNYQKFCKEHPKQIEQLEHLLSTFLHLFKCNNHKLIDFNKFLKQSKRNVFRYKKEKILLILALNVYLLYQRALEENNEIDFDDMLIKASEQVEKGYNKKVKYIIIDEYQDTSYIRFKLVKNIIDKTGAKLMVVGDDFQSIYRFTGCDISLFLDFKKYFNDAKIMKIENTYRNSQELINIAGQFVMKNKKQMKKELKSNKHISNPIIIKYYNNIKEDFKNLILKIYENTKKPIMVIGRNNNDIKYVLDNKYFKLEDNKIIYLKDKNIAIYYLTAHKSKGLEEENVIIINMSDNIIGFPSQIKDDKFLRFVLGTKKNYPYDEERRLFYVALTRTKNTTYLFVPYKNPSVFVHELLKNNKKYIKVQKI